MSKREDIIDKSEILSKDGGQRKYGLIYTKKCGWIDLGHANPIGGAKTLINQVRAIGNSLNHPSYAKREKEVTYSQGMTRKFKQLSTTIHLERTYAVRTGINYFEQNSIALSIFMDVLIEFETLQSNWFFNRITDSGFSVEDLTSDLLGFYQEIYPGTNFITLCEPASKEEALAIWDTYGAVGSVKNETFNPMFFPNPLVSCGRPLHGKLPHFLDTIRPAKLGDGFRKIK